MSHPAAPRTLRSGDRYALSAGDLLARLRKIEGQVRGLQSMIDRQERCVDVLDQIASVQGALHAVAVGLVDADLRQHLADVCDPARADVVDESLEDVMRGVERLVRS